MNYVVVPAPNAGLSALLAVPGLLVILFGAKQLIALDQSHLPAWSLYRQKAETGESISGCLAVLLCRSVLSTWQWSL